MAYMGRIKILAVLAALIMGVFVGSAAQAAETGTEAEAKALLDRALATIASEGREAAFAKFTKADGGFVDRDLYVFVFDLDGKTLAHGGNPRMVGQNVAAVKDVDGKPFMQEMLKLAKDAGGGSIDYKWMNATTKKIEAKRSLIKRVDDFLVGVGVYVK